MMSLGQIPYVGQNISTATTKAIKAFHRFIFEEEGDRNNRKRLRAFEGFKFKQDSEEHKAKLQFAIDNIQVSDVIAISNILHLDYSGTQEELIGNICSCLMDLSTLTEDVRKDETQDDSDGSDDDSSSTNSPRNVAEGEQNDPDGDAASKVETERRSDKKNSKQTNEEHPVKKKETKKITKEREVRKNESKSKNSRSTHEKIDPRPKRRGSVSTEERSYRPKKKEEKAYRKTKTKRRISKNSEDENDYEENTEDEDLEDRTADDEATQDELSEDEVCRDGDYEDEESNEDDNEYRRHRKPESKFAMTFRDVEDTIRPFEGKDDYAVEKWLEDFEESALLLGWNDVQKLIFAKKLLKGVAKLFVRSESGINSWRKLRKALIAEFSSKVNSAEIHKRLAQRQIKRDESLEEYFFTMKEIASRGNVENDALFQYIIDGIDDEVNNKIILYGANDMKQFREKLEIYSQIRSKKKGKPERSNVTRVRVEKKSEKVEPKSIRCFNCGSKGHKADDCKQKSMGQKCFNCNKFGHRAVECTQPKRVNTCKEENKVVVNSVNNNLLAKMYKKVKLANVEFDALIDTGSALNVIKESLYRKLDSPVLQNSSLLLTGFGKNQTKVMGYFQGTVQVDNDNFPTTIYVVTDDVMTMNAIIGNELLEKAEVTINQEGLQIKKLAEEALLMNIAIETDELDIGPVENEEVKDEIEEIVSRFTPNKTKSTDIEMKIIVKEEKPIFDRPRRLPLPEQQVVEEQVQQWIEDGIVEPCSSEYSSQVVLVRKKDGSPRVCIDYRKINKQIVKDRYPLPLIDDILDRLQDARVFTTIDLTNGFFHVNVEESSRKYTSFVIRSGQYQFLKVPFGLCNSPAVFQHFINTVFHELMSKKVVLPYMDDLIIPSQDEHEAVEKLKLVLDTASDYGLHINKRKCHFAKRTVEFLGHIVEDGKLHPSPLKTKAVQCFPEPTSIKQIQSFLGLSGYFRKFIPNYSTLAKPLSDLLKRDQVFRFEEKEREAFMLLKKALTEHPVLHIFRPDRDTELHTDASKYGYGAVLLQKCPEDDSLHPVYYTSRKTTSAEQNYSSYELETLAVIQAVKKFRIYLLGQKFKIVTDCAAFQKTMDKKDLTTRVARWALLLEEFDYQIEHRSGSRMRHVDALSRFPVMMTVEESSLLSKIRCAQRDDEELKPIFEMLKTQEYDDYCLLENMLYKFKDGRYLLVIPRRMQYEIITTAHQKGHYAVKRTEEEISQQYYIPKIRRKVERCIANCLKCIVGNRKSGKMEGYLHPLFKEAIPLHTYHADHLGPLDTTSKNYKYILAIIDSFTKFVWLYPTKTTSSKEVIAKLEIQKKYFGNPAQIITDKGSAFTSQEFLDYCDQEKIRKLAVTTGLPRANGQVEIINKIIIPVLTKLSLDDPRKWYRHIDTLQQTINSTYTRSINTTPFELMFGTKMRTASDLRIQELLEDEMLKIHEELRREFREQARQQILKIQQENRRSFNRKRRPASSYQVNDLVAIKRTQFGPGLKLKPKFLGPYRIVKVKPNDTYDVERDGDYEGPKKTTTCAEYIKPWSQTMYSSSSSSGSADEQDGRIVGPHRSESRHAPRSSPRERESQSRSSARGEYARHALRPVE